jgi:ABC-type taurine transport system substrate-binding protein
MLLFNSGPAQMEALPSKQWSIGATSTGGMFVGAMRYNVQVVAPILQEGETISIYMRPDAPAAKIKGANPAFPEVYGSAATFKGKTILFTSQTTSHYNAGKWLEALGLSESDVKMVNMEQPSMIPAFEKGIGDAMALWAPFTFAAEKKGFKLVTTGIACDSRTSSMYIADKAWAEKNPELVSKFLKVSYRTSDMLLKEGASPRIVMEYQSFMNEFCGIKMDGEVAKMDLEKHPRWSLAEAKVIMNASGGESQYAKEQRAAAEFFTKLGRYSQKELDTFNKKNFIVDKYLKLIN